MTSMTRYLVENLGIWFGLGMVLLIVGLLVERQLIEGLELEISKLTLAIVGMLFFIMISKLSSIELTLKKMNDKV